MLWYALAVSLTLCAMLVFSERSHRATQRKLIDRLLEKNGLAPLTEPEPEVRMDPKVKKEISKIIFNIPGMPPKKVGPLGGER